MEQLLKKVRALTYRERKNLAHDGIFLTNFQEKDLERISLRVLEILFDDDELDGLSFEDEQKLVTEVFNKTYGISEKDEKN